MNGFANGFANGFTTDGCASGVSRGGREAGSAEEVGALLPCDASASLPELHQKSNGKTRDVMVTIETEENVAKSLVNPTTAF